MKSYYRRSESVAVVEAGGQAYVAIVPEGPIVVLDGTARQIWELAPGSPPDRLPRLVAERFGVTEQEVNDGVFQVMKQLISHGLVHEVTRSD